MEEAEQIVKDAKSVLSLFKFNLFVQEFCELLRVPRVRNWRARSIRIFETVLDCDYLMIKLFSFFDKKWERHHELYFLGSIYLSLDIETFRRFFVEMVNFAALRNQEERQIVGNRLLEIVKERELQQQWESRILGTPFLFRFYEKFRFLFDMYLTLPLPRYNQLRDILDEHKSRGSPKDEKEIDRLTSIALNFFGPNEFLTHRFLNFCTGDSVKLYLVVPIEQNRPLSNSETRNNPIPISTSTDGEGIQYIQLPNPASPISEIPVRNSYPVQCSSTLNTPTSVLAVKNHPALNLSSPYSPEPDSATAVAHRHSVQGIQIPEHPTLVSAVPVRTNYPVLQALTWDKQNGKHNLDLRIQGDQYPQTPVEPRSSVNDPRISNPPIRPSFSGVDYFEPLVKID